MCYQLRWDLLPPFAVDEQEDTVRRKLKWGSKFSTGTEAGWKDGRQRWRQKHICYSKKHSRHQLCDQYPSDSHLNHWELTGVSSHLENFLHSNAFNDHDFQSGCFGSSGWSHGSTAFHCEQVQKLNRKRLVFATCNSNDRVLSLRSLSWYDYSDLRGPVHGLSLPHAIFHNRDQISRAVHRDNDLVVHFLMPGALLLESAFVSFAGRNLPRYLSHYLHISLHKNVRNRSTSRQTDSRSEASSRNLKLCK